MSTDSLIELAELVSKSNYYKFNDRFREQNEGTSIGTKFPPNYAIMILSVLEEESVLKRPWLWWRYIDDVYDNHCNQLEKWLFDRNYKQKLIREQILKTRIVYRENCLIMKETLGLRIGWDLI